MFLHFPVITISFFWWTSTTSFVNWTDVPTLNQSWDGNQVDFKIWWIRLKQLNWLKREYFESLYLLMIKSDDICNDTNKHYLCQHITEKCANNNANANSKINIRKGETTKVISKWRSLSLACNVTKEMNCDKRKTTKEKKIVQKK